MTTDDLVATDHASRKRPRGRTALIAAALGLTVVAGGALVRSGEGESPAALPDSSVSTTSTAVPATSSAPPPAELTPASPATTAPTMPTTAAPTLTAVPVAGPAAEPVPLLAVFDGDRVTLEGAVPSEDARAYIEGLAAANTKGTAVIDNRLTIDPSVPLTVPVRVIELQSARFPSGSAEIVLEHAAELDRVANIMLAFPSVSLLVVGHADQVGSDAANLQLSQARAGAVVTYLVSKGVAVDRLSARGVGETDLLAEDLGDDALALNRRTEFIFTGILAE